MTDPAKNDVELARIRCAHVETLVALVIVGLVAIGGFVCVFEHIEAGPTILIAVTSLITGFVCGTRRSIRRS